MTQPESRLQRKIQEALKRSGAFVFKVHGGEHMMSGLPDLVICYRGVFIGLEVKMPGGKVSPIQRLRHKQIREARGVCHVVYGVDDALAVIALVDQKIQRFLDSQSPPHTK